MNRIVERFARLKQAGKKGLVVYVGAGDPTLEATRGLALALDLAGVAVSTGAACAAGAVEPSHVLRAMGLPLERVQASLRFSLGRGTTAEHVDRAAKLVVEAVDKQRKTSRAYASKS